MAEKQRGRPARSTFYHARWNKVGLNVERAAEILGVDVEQIEQWDWDGCELAERYLLLWDKKHLTGEWHGWLFTRGKLKYKSLWWTPSSLLKWRDQDDEINKLQAEIRRLKTLSGIAETISQKFKHRRRS